MMRNYEQCVTMKQAQWRKIGAEWRRISMFTALSKNANGARMAQIAHLTGTLPGVTLAALAKQLASVKRRPRKIPHQIIPVSPFEKGRAYLRIVGINPSTGGSDE